MRDNEKCNISPVRTAISDTKCIGVTNPEGPEKYNNIEMKSIEKKSLSDTLLID